VIFIAEVILIATNVLPAYVYCDMTPESQKSSLVGNGSVNGFPTEMNLHATREEPVSKQRFGKR
jgi:hypothetical protein